MKKKYYSLDSILASDATYNIIFGKRSNGKSYAVKKYCLECALLDENRKLVYLRRYSMDITAYLVEQYFSDLDIKSITDGKQNAVEVRAKKINLVFIDENGKRKNRKCIGYTMHLSGVEHFKSIAYPDVENMIFEEFVTNEGYLLNEPDKLMNIISTVFRDRKGKIYMIGNTVNRICPYFTEWQLTGIPTQEQNTIDIYKVKYDDIEIRIACEYCGDSESNQKNNFFFGKQADSIIKGDWERGTYPKPPKEKNDVILMRILLHHEQFDYVINVMRTAKGEGYLKITPAGLQEHSFYTLVLSREFSTKPTTLKTLAVLPIGIVLRRLFTAGKACYSDNLTGTEFNNILKDWDIW